MIKIRAFKALRPKDKWVKEVAALPYDVMTEEEAKKMVGGHPYSFLNIDKPEIHNLSAEDNPYLYVSKLLFQMKDEGVFIQDSNCLYIYELISGFGHQYGLVCLVSARDYQEEKIKKHEQTRKDKEDDRVQHIAYCKAHTGPVFLIEDEIPQFGVYLKDYASRHMPLYDFMNEDHITHRIYAVSEKEQIDYLIKCFAQIKALYIADGHHRAAAASRVSKKLGDRWPEADDFLAVVFPKEQLHILPYHRIIKDESGYNKVNLLDKLAEKFQVTPVEASTYLPAHAHEIGMYYQNQWYSLQIKPECLKDKSAAEGLDVAVLQREVLGPIFRIGDPRTDSRIDFVPGLPDIQLIQESQKRNMDMIFTLYPTSVEDLISVARAGEMMPPKSTWFEPKLRSGILIHMF